QLDQLQEAHADLSSAQAQLIRAERLAVVGTLSAGLAHEIGNPLAVVSGFTELLKDPSLALEEQESALKRIEHELDRIQSIVRDLLDFSRASSESKGECRISDALADLKGLLDPQRRFASVELSVSSLVEPVARIEKSAFLQVMVNLALNAADAMNGSGQVRVSAQAFEEYVSVRVEDSGPGVPDSDHAKVFEPFFTTKPAGLGTGLGLAVCERIVEAVGGTLTVGRSQDLGGACFELLLPKV
ncbi:MAG: HAMP domain-containing sensor histidine kinase, partial [Myxococcota bacterium]